MPKIIIKKSKLFSQGYNLFELISHYFISIKNTLFFSPSYIQSSLFFFSRFVFNCDLFGFKSTFLNGQYCALFYNMFNFFVNLEKPLFGLFNF